MFRSKIDLLCLEERDIVSKMKLVLLRELLNVLCNIKEYCLEAKYYCKQNETFTTINVFSIKLINDYHNSSRVRHGTRLQVLPFDS